MGMLDNILGILPVSERGHSLFKLPHESQNEFLERIKYYEYIETCARLGDNMEKETFNTGAQKETEGKLRFDLIPPEVEKAYAEVLSFGCKKYSDRNWEKGIPNDVCIAALRRHLNQFQLGETINEESGLNHLKHVLFWASALVTFAERDTKK